MAINVKLHITAWDYWAFGFCPSSTILKNMTFQKLDLSPFSGEGVQGAYSVGLLKTAKPNHWMGRHSVGFVRKSQFQSLDHRLT
jgi:hypothetical protein